MSKINMENKTRKLTVKKVKLAHRMKVMLTFAAAAQGFMIKSPVEVYNLLGVFSAPKPWALLNEHDRNTLRAYIKKWNVEDFI